MYIYIYIYIYICLYMYIYLFIYMCLHLLMTFADDVYLTLVLWTNSDLTSLWPLRIEQRPAGRRC